MNTPVTVRCPRCNKPVGPIHNCVFPPGVVPPPPTPAGVEARVAADIARRQELGLRKYGVTVEDNPHGSADYWLQHAYEECLDAAVYLKALLELRQRKGVA